MLLTAGYSTISRSVISQNPLFFLFCQPCSTKRPPLSSQICNSGMARDFLSRAFRFARLVTCTKPMPQSARAISKSPQPKQSLVTNLFGMGKRCSTRATEKPKLLSRFIDRAPGFTVSKSSFLRQAETAGRRSGCGDSPFVPSAKNFVRGQAARNSFPPRHCHDLPHQRPGARRVR